MRQESQIETLQVYDAITDTNREIMYDDSNLLYIDFGQSSIVRYENVLI